jgi:ABC-type uncharacterized transport system permease subunit
MTRFLKFWLRLPCHVPAGIVGGIVAGVLNLLGFPYWLCCLEALLAGAFIGWLFAAYRPRT